MTKQTPRRRRSRVQKTKTPLYLGLALATIVIGVIVFAIVLNDDDSVGETVAGNTNIPAFDSTIAVGQTEEGFWYKGAEDAPIEVIEYADYECPACRSFGETLRTTNFDEKYVKTGLVKFIYHEFPLSSIHPAAYTSAEVARCAGDQDLYWPVHNALFATQTQWDGGNDSALSIMVDAAAQVGADAEELRACVEAGTHADAVRAAESAASARGVSSTPTFYVNGQQVASVGLLDVVESLAQQETTE